MRYLILLLLILSPTAFADPGSIIAFIVTYASGATVIAGITFSSVLVASLAVAAATFALSKILAPKVGVSYGLGDQARTSTIRSSASERKIIYGNVKVNGLLTFLEIEENSGDTGDYAHIVIVWAHQRSEAIDGVFINDTYVANPSTGNAVTSGKYADLVEMYHHLGNQTTADSRLVARHSKWTSKHKLLGQTYSYFRIENDREVFPQGLPGITALIKGKRVLDPRLPTSGSQVRYSENPILCAYDYLLSELYGLNTNNVRSIVAAANICDERITSSNEGGLATNEARYAMAAIIGMNEGKLAVLDKIRQACDGQFYYSGGDWVFDVGRVKTTETRKITEDDLVGGVTFNTNISNRELFNTITPKFINKGDKWRVVTGGDIRIPAAVTADGREIIKVIDYSYIRTGTRAAALAAITLLKHRNKKSLQIIGKFCLLQYELGDVVKVELSHLNIEDTLFEIVDIKLVGLDITLTLNEYTTGVYADSPAVEFDFIPIPLPDNKREYIRAGTYTWTAPSGAIGNRFNIYIGSPIGSSLRCTDTATGTAQGGAGGYYSDTRILVPGREYTIVIPTIYAPVVGVSCSLLTQDLPTGTPNPACPQSTPYGLIYGSVIRNTRFHNTTITGGQDGIIRGAITWVTQTRPISLYRYCEGTITGATLHNGTDSPYRTGRDRGASRVIIEWANG